MIRTYEPTRVVSARPTQIAARFEPPRRPSITPTQARALQPKPIMVQAGIDFSKLPPQVRKSAEAAQKLIESQRAKSTRELTAFGFSGGTARDKAVLVAAQRRKESNPLATYLKRMGGVARPITSLEFNALHRQGGPYTLPPGGLEIAQGPRFKPGTPTGYEGGTRDFASPGTAEYNTRPSVPASVSASSGASDYFNADPMGFDAGPVGAAESTVGEDQGPATSPASGGIWLAVIAAALSFLK